MAMYVDITKQSESNSVTVFKYEGDNISGLMELDMVSGAITPMNQVQKGCPVFQRAAAKVHQHWVTGIIPDKTSWAS